jgi:peptidyl-prolyl cis-trans isomerase C
MPNLCSPYFLRKSLVLGLLILSLSACSLLSSSPSPSPSTTTPETNVTQTGVEPTHELTVTATQVPLAAMVNGEGILLSDYETELQRYTAALEETGIQSDTQQNKQTVLESLIDELLLSQAARGKGYSLSDTDLDAHINDLTQQIGGVEKLKEWQQANYYTEESFRAATRRSMEAAWYRDQISAAVPDQAEQVHARQILVFDADLAREIHSKLDAGADFATLAEMYDPVTKGDLGWFPRGYLLLPVVEEAAFNLLPGKYSDVIETDYGYHIIQVIDRQERYPLSVDARNMLVRKSLEDWVAERRTQSQVQILIN